MGGSAEIKKDLLEALDQRELQVVGLIDIYGFTFEETGALLGDLTKQHVFMIRARALEKIKKIYDHYEYKQTVAVV